MGGGWGGGSQTDRDIETCREMEMDEEGRGCSAQITQGQKTQFDIKSYIIFT